MLLDKPIQIGKLNVSNRLVMPPMQTGMTDRGHVTEELVRYYRDRAAGSRPGIIITEHSCIVESGRAAEAQLSIAADDDDRRAPEAYRRNPRGRQQGLCAAQPRRQQRRGGGGICK